MYGGLNADDMEAVRAAANVGQRTLTVVQFCTRTAGVDREMSLVISDIEVAGYRLESVVSLPLYPHGEQQQVLLLFRLDLPTGG